MKRKCQIFSFWARPDLGTSPRPVNEVSKADEDAIFKADEEKPCVKFKLSRKRSRDPLTIRLLGQTGKPKKKELGRQPWRRLNLNLRFGSVARQG